MKRLTWIILFAIFASFTAAFSGGTASAAPQMVSSAETACTNWLTPGLGATLYNACVYNIGIKHWPSSPGVYEFVLPVGHCSTEHYVDCEMAWVAAGRDYSLQRQNLDGRWLTISAGHGGRYVNMATNDHFRIYQWKTGSKAPASALVGDVTASADSIPPEGVAGKTTIWNSSSSAASIGVGMRSATHIDYNLARGAKGGANAYATYVPSGFCARLSVWNGSGWSAAGAQKAGWRVWGTSNYQTYSAYVYRLSTSQPCL